LVIVKEQLKTIFSNSKHNSCHVMHFVYLF